MGHVYMTEYRTLHTISNNKQINPQMNENHTIMVGQIW